MHIKLNFTYDIFNRTEPSRILIAKTGKRILGELNGIQQDTCTLTINTNNTSTLDFTIDRIVDGEISNYYQYLKQYAELYVTNVGWFKINEEPELSYDGNTESSTIHAESLEIELQQYDLVGFKVNCGTEDSWEMMATDNVYTDSDGYSIPRESVKFYRDTTQFEELMTVFADTTGSLTDLNNLLYTYPDMLLSWRITLDLTTFDSAIRKAIVDMKADGDDTSVIESMIGTSWTQESARTMGSVYPYIFKYATIEVDTTNSESSSSDSTGDTENDTTTNYSLTEILDRELERQHQLSFLWLVLNEHNWKVGYIDDYVDTDTSTPLKDMVGKFEVDSQDIYSFLTQEVANYFRCIFVFNTNDYSVDAYKVENLGEDTNICLNFSNVENSITKSSDKQIYTVYHVSNNDSDNELDIREVNIGDDSIINLSYFMNIDNFTQEFIDKYNAWQETWSTKRLEYKDLSLQYRNQNDVVTELYYRVPTDMADTSQYEDFTDDELKNERTGLEAQLKGYETLYVDKDGNFDLNALKASEDWKTYKLIKNIIIPNIDIELYNRGLDNKEDYLDFDDSYEYDFDTYGDSYGVQELTIQRDTLKNNLDLLAEKGYDKEGESGDEYHAQQYELHQKYLKAYNSCVKVLEQRQAEYDTANAKLTDIQTQRQTIKTETAISNSSFGFTSAELALLDKYYFHTDYVNENIITTSLSTNEDIIDTIEQLYQDACEQLSADSQPQYNFSTTLDNLLILPEFKDWHGDLSVNNFIRVSVREDYQIKLRVISMTFNPYMIDNSLDLTFSNMVQYKSKRNDYVDLVNSAVSSAKNQITSTISSNKSDTDTFNIDANLVRKLINNNAFSGQMNNIISGYIQANNGTVNNLVAQKIDAMNINVSKITGTTAEFDELFTKYIDADYINSRVVISDIGEFKDLSAQVAMIDNLLAGNVSAEMAHIIKLTAQNVNIDEAVIRDLIAANITVSMLQASEINTDKFKIKSDDGNLEIVGNTMQFKDTNGTTRIQIGNDANDNFTFCLYDETGNGVLIDSTGIKDSAISDGLIKNNMVADGSLSKDKLNFNIVEGDADGNLDASKVIINGQGIDAEFTSIKNEIENVKSETEPTINVILSNESQNIPCTDDGLVSIEHTIDIDFICYLGLTQIPCSVVISDLPTGITVKSNTSSTASKNGTITLNVAKGSNLGGADVLNGKIVLTFSVNGNKIEKWFSWSKTKDGHQGIDGDSITITSKSITYVESDSGTITPTSGWSETIPNVANSNFLWTKTEVVYSDGNSTVSYGVSRQGSDGVGYKANLLLGTSEPAKVTGTNVNAQWSGSLYDFEVGSITKLSAGTYTISGTITVTGSDGGTLKVQSNNVPYLTLYTIPLKTGTWTFESQFTYTPSANDKASAIGMRLDYLPTDTTITLSNVMLVKGDKSAEWSYATSELKGEQGEKGVQGEKGDSATKNLVKNGFGEYLGNTNFSKATYTRGDVPDGCWGFFTAPKGTVLSSEYVPFDKSQDYDLSFYARNHEGVTTSIAYLSIAPYDVDGKIIYTQHIATYFNPNKFYLAEDLKKGDTVVKFTDLTNWNVNTKQAYQRGLLFYGYTDSTGYTYPDFTYSQNYYNGMYADNSSVDLTNNTITLKTAWTGKEFNAGTAVSQVAQGDTYCYYGLSGNLTSSDWKQYHATIKFDGSDTVATRMMYAKYYKVGMLVDNGTVDFTGINIPSVKDGVSPTVTSTKTEYVQSSSGTTTPTSGWGTTPQTATAGYYMWTRTTVTYSDGKTAVSYSVSKNGTNGSNAVIYNIECSDLVIKKEIDNTLTPSTVTFSSYSKDGNSTTRNAYSGRFIIAESTDGTNFTTKYTSSANESSKKYTPSNSSITSIKCTLYASGGTTNALDSQTVHILTDADGVNEELLSVKSTISGVSSKVDNVEKSITNKVWETDIETQINNYDSSTVEVIRNKNSEMSQTIDKLSSTVSNVETTVATKADGSTIDTLFKQIATQEQSINGFKTTVSNTYATKDELNNTSSSLESSIEQSSEEFTISISKVNESLTTQKTSQENFHNTITTYFNFNDDGLNIGKTNEQYSINIDNEKMSFQQNQMEVAYIQYNKMHINAIEAVDRLSVGASSNGGYFDFISTAYGMGVKWRVEDSESVQPISTINKVARVKQVYVAIEDDSNVFFVNFGGDK